MSDVVWTALLGSTVVAAILGGALGGWFTLRVARNQYVNDYYKTVVERRLVAYEQLEDLITMLKTCVVDDGDNRVYHLLFSGGDNVDAFKALFKVSSQAMWLSDEIVDETIKLNRLLYGSPKNSVDPFAFAKENYKA